MTTALVGQAGPVRITREMWQDPGAVDWAAIRDEWCEAVRDLYRQVSDWARDEEWTVAEKSHSLEEPHLGRYELPLLWLHLPEGQVFLEPVGRLTAGGDGRIDFNAWPTMDRVLLIRRGGNWILRAEAGPVWPLPWGREAFVDLARRLARDADE